MKTISKDQRLQLIGLYSLAKTHTDALNSLSEAMREIVKEEDEWGHVGDLLWATDTENANSAIRSLLKKLEIKVN